MFCAQAITCLPRFASELRARGGQYIVSKPPQISHHVRSLRAGMPGSRSRERCQACWQQLMRAMLMQHLGSLQHGPTHATRTPTRARRVSFANAIHMQFDGDAQVRRHHWQSNTATTLPCSMATLACSTYTYGNSALLYDPSYERKRESRPGVWHGGGGAVRAGCMVGAPGAAEDAFYILHAVHAWCCLWLYTLRPR